MATFKIAYREQGRGKPSIERFKTLEAAKDYIKDRWEGPDYIDGPASFHNDFCRFTLEGFTLQDIGKFTIEEEGFRNFKFNENA